VGVNQDAGDIGHEASGFLGRQATLAQPPGQVGAVDQVGDEKVAPALPADVVDGDDAGVPQPGHLAGLGH
jgi:hypothetical protein